MYNADAVFTLAYAVIMLNVDQHNTNAKKQNIPMTIQVGPYVQYLNRYKDSDINTLNCLRK